MVANTITFLFFVSLLTHCQCDGKRVILSFDKKENQIQHQEYEPYDQPPLTWLVDVAYADSYEKTGWSMAEFTMNPDADAQTLAYSAGYADGLITKARIDQHWNNTIGDYCQSSPLSESCKKLEQFLQENLDWMKGMIEKNPKDPYWTEVQNVLLQVQGLEDGYNNKPYMDFSIRLKPFGFLLFQLGGDMEDLEVALGLEKYFNNRVVGSGSCSALIKLVKDKSGKMDLFSAHDTWAPYNGMLRIMKRFNFPGFTEAYSGYPGSILSGDDFYILSSGLVTMETTIGNSNPKLWSYISPHTVMEWSRNIVANRLAKDGHDWCTIFEQHNSGTYNNEWMIVDYNQFQNNPNSKVLHVLEQLPGQIVYSDVTDVLNNQTYWASYNIPYFKSIFNNSGQPAFVKKYGDWFTHDKNPRAKMFALYHDEVMNMGTLIDLMRYNDFKNDPISSCNCTPPYSAENTIAARSDLNDPNGKYPFGALKQRNHGATDVKATSVVMMKSYSMMAECGPTHDQQPYFQWSTSPYAKSSHVGHPDIFNFNREHIVWEK